MTDEFLYWTRWHFNYWSRINLGAVIVIGCILTVSYIYRKKPGATIRLWLAAFIPVILIILVLANWFSRQNFNIYQNQELEKIVPTAAANSEQ